MVAIFVTQVFIYFSATVIAGVSASISRRIKERYVHHGGMDAMDDPNLFETT